MREEVKRLDAEYGFKLSEEEIEQIAEQAEAANRLFQPLNDVDLLGVMPIMKVDKKVKE
jgi:Asp-tRNA(Asn)/Glu-tRNA(Gln) amidotransferase C subunit